MTTCVIVLMLSEVWRSNHHQSIYSFCLTHRLLQLHISDKKKTVQSSEKLLHFHHVCMKILPGMQQDQYWSNKSWSCFTYFTDKSKKKNQYLIVKKKSMPQWDIWILLSLACILQPQQRKWGGRWWLFPAEPSTTSDPSDLDTHADEFHHIKSEIRNQRTYTVIKIFTVQSISTRLRGSTTGPRSELIPASELCCWMWSHCGLLGMLMVDVGRLSEAGRVQHVQY